MSPATPLALIRARLLDPGTEFVHAGPRPEYIPIVDQSAVELHLTHALSLTHRKHSAERNYEGQRGSYA